MGKNENWHLLLFHCRYFDKSLLSGPLPNIYFLSKLLSLICFHVNQKATFAKDVKKSTPQKLYGDKAETLFIALACTKRLFFFFIDVAYSLWLLWQLKSSHNGKYENWALIAVLLQEI